MGKKGATKNVLVIPCSGIGKVHGLLSREAMYEIVGKPTNVKTDTLCLALLVMGDEAALSKTRNSICLTIDGCPKFCAKKGVEATGGQVSRSILVNDALKNHRGEQFGTAAKLTDCGWDVVHEIAEGLETEIVKLRGGGDE